MLWRQLLVSGGHRVTMRHSRHEPLQPRDSGGQPVRSGLRRRVPFQDLAVRQVGRRGGWRPSADAQRKTRFRPLAHAQRVLAGAARKGLRQVRIFVERPVGIYFELKQNSLKTVSKLFWNCFVSVLFQFHFNCADSFSRLWYLYSIQNRRKKTVKQTVKQYYDYYYLLLQTAIFY